MNGLPAPPMFTCPHRAEHLDTVPVELPGSHSPFLSRPVQLVEALLELVAR